MLQEFGERGNQCMLGAPGESLTVEVMRLGLDHEERVGFVYKER